MAEINIRRNMRILTTIFVFFNLSFLYLNVGQFLLFICIFYFCFFFNILKFRLSINYLYLMLFFLIYLGNILKIDKLFKKYIYSVSRPQKNILCIPISLFILTTYQHFKCSERYYLYFLYLPFKVIKI